MVILHDAMKTIQNGVFPFSSKKERNLCLFKKPQTCFFLTKKRWVVFLKNPGFSQPWFSG